MQLDKGPGAPDDPDPKLFILTTAPTTHTPLDADSANWDNGVPNDLTRAVIPRAVTISIDSIALCMGLHFGGGGGQILINQAGMLGINSTEAPSTIPNLVCHNGEL